ncbi:DUF1848 domain-containing protein [Chlorobium sp. N1]|uniref:DUF1848 domain-containing protein n=1 Tax=Chlorobium sp. N1 TaxID=2491138 RepID=UPI0010390884|nr:DUF1848 domain-containing protein [Chlorobium sp. N1]TCD47163.1 DUF1848 domain-containing protein [Chlorobium sp. N1]
MIISASRRTDIPAFHAGWFMERLRSGEVMVANPMRRDQVSRIDLSREAVDGFVFWTKDPGPFMEHLDEIEGLGYPFYFLFTLTPYGPDIEPGVPPKALILERFHELSQRLGPERVVWRYDPVILTERMDSAWHLEAFEGLARELRGRTCRSVLSFVDDYRKIRRRMQAIGALEPDAGQMAAVAGGCARIASECGMELSACSESLDFNALGVRPGRCVDRELLRRIAGLAEEGMRGGRKKDPGQRPRCGCAPSRDIGTYGTCSHRCIYCYAS